MSNQSRVQPGVPAGGQFAATAKAAPDDAVALTAQDDGTRARREKGIDRLREASAAIEKQGQAQVLAGVAELIQRDHPHIASLAFQWDEEYNAPRAETLYGHDGAEIDKDEDDWAASDAIDEMLSMHSPFLQDIHDELAAAYRQRRQPERFVVAEHAKTPPIPEAGTHSGAVYSAQRALTDHLEHWEGQEDQQAYAVQDFLVDLTHYARVQGLNLTELLESAQEVATYDRRAWGLE